MLLFGSRARGLVLRVSGRGNAHRDGVPCRRPSSYQGFRNSIHISAGGFIALWGSLAGAFGQFDAAPYDMAADGVGNAYLLDTLNSRVQVFDSAGNVKGQWGSFGTGKGQFSFPDGSHRRTESRFPLRQLDRRR